MAKKQTKAGKKQDANLKAKKAGKRVSASGTLITSHVQTEVIKTEPRKFNH